MGTIAGWLYLAGSALLIKLRIDDAVDAIPVHLVGGAWGLISSGLFTTRICSTVYLSKQEN
jgi:ammonium transporter, Amt family